jgi:hypothetical protein
MNIVNRLLAIAVAGSFAGLTAPALAQAPAQSPVAVPDLTGSWNFASEKGAPTRVLVLKQQGTSLTGEMRVRGVPPIPFAGAADGDQMDVMALLSFQGGELIHIRCTYKDGRLVGRVSSIHSSPAKWHFDMDRAEELVRAP